MEKMKSATTEVVADNFLYIVTSRANCGEKT